MHVIGSKPFESDNLLERVDDVLSVVKRGNWQKWQKVYSVHCFAIHNCWTGQQLNYLLT